MTMKIFFLSLAILISKLTLSQKIDTVGLEIASYYPESVNQGYSPFILRIKNNSKQPIRIPTQFMINDTSFDMINIIADVYYNGILQSKEVCEICGRVYFDTGVLLEPNKSYLIQPTIACYSLVSGSYKIRFRFDEEKKMLYGVTNWFSFKVD
jgi:hypothetical protein